MEVSGQHIDPAALPPVKKLDTLNRRLGGPKVLSGRVARREKCTVPAGIQTADRRARSTVAKPTMLLRIHDDDSS